MLFFFRKFDIEIIEIVDDEIIEGILTCEEGHTFFIHKGIIDFCSNEQSIANQWSESYKKIDYEAYDKQIESLKSDKEKQQQQLILNYFIHECSRMDEGIIVDIASGRGMLLTKLSAFINPSVSMVATDLSFEVLMYDRLKIKKINPAARVNYIACDATKMPFRAESIDVAVSFFGIANMLGIVKNGVEEASRILKSNGKLMNSFIIINEDSTEFEIVKKACNENQLFGAENAYLLENIEKIHDTYFKNVCCHVIVEDVRGIEENKIDLLPYPGEWFAEVVYKCTK